MREYIENSDQAKFKDIEQIEKKLDSQRRTEKVDRMKKIEKEMILQ
jgi:hypothetical protein